MKRNYFRMLVVSFGAAVLAAAAYGDSDRLVVDIPYDFVVHGTTLPAGKYNVRRNSDSEVNSLSISSVENTGHAVVTLSTVAEYNRGSQTGVTLVRTGDQNILTKIRTAEHVFNIPVSPATNRR